MHRITKLLTERIDYSPGITTIIDLPREGFITEITFMVKLWRGSKRRFLKLLSDSVVCIEFPEKSISILPSRRAHEYFVSRNTMAIVWHPGPNVNEPFDSVAIPAFFYSYLILKWIFPDEPLGATGHIAIKINEKLPPENHIKKKKGG